MANYGQNKGSVSTKQDLHTVVALVVLIICLFVVCFFFISIYALFALII